MGKKYVKLNSVVPGSRKINIGKKSMYETVTEEKYVKKLNNVRWLP